MTDLNRLVAEVLLRAHQAEWGPTASNPTLQNPITSETVNVQLEEMDRPIGHDAVMSILRDLAGQDYITLAPKSAGDSIITVRKVYPARMKRDFNLWHIAEDAF